MPVRTLPTVELSFGKFFVDIRLDEIRNVTNPSEAYRMDYVLDNPTATEADHKAVVAVLRAEMERL